MLDQSIIAQTVRAPHISGTSVSRTDKAWTALLRTLCDQPASNLKLVTSVLRAGTRPVSYEIALRYKGRHLSCQTAYDKELAQHSPNLLHTYLSQVQALKDGLETFEILIAGDPGPKAWSDYTIGSSDFQSAFNLTGRMLSSRLAQYAKPVLQRIPGKNADAKATPAAAQHAMMARVSRVHAH